MNEQFFGAWSLTEKGELLSVEMMEKCLLSNTEELGIRLEKTLSLIASSCSLGK